MKLTIHISQNDNKGMPPSEAFLKLKQWSYDGRVELVESNRAPDNGRVERRSPLPWEKKPAKGITFQQIASILFPQRDIRRLSMNEINDVAHLIAHHASGRTAFVTNNVQDFLSDGKQARLKTGFKIIVLTPEEAVAVIESELSTQAKEVAK